VVDGVSCNVAGVSCNITENTCNITRVRVRRIHKASTLLEPGCSSYSAAVGALFKYPLGLLGPYVYTYVIIYFVRFDVVVYVSCIKYKNYLH